MPEDQTEAQLKEYVRKRGTAKGKITKQVNKLKKIEKQPVKTRGILHAVQELLEKAWDEFNDYHDQILSLVEDDEDALTQHEDEYDDVVQNYEDAKAMIYDMLNGPQPLTTPSQAGSQTPESVYSGNSAMVATASTTEDSTKLPKLDLPTFSGNYEDWPSFSDLFESSVHNNKKLTGARKLQYLKGCVKGEAEQLISYLKITNENYDIAWKILANRYQHEREIINAHLRILLNQPKVTPNDVQSLRQLVNVTNECVKSINVLNVPTDQWDAILNFIVTERLDPTLRLDWEKELPDDKIPKHDKLMTFLETRLRQLTSNTINKETLASTSTTRPAANSTKQRKCPSCSGEHTLSYCPSFTKLSVEERWKVVRKTRLCANCLRGGHERAQCRGGSCKECQGRHNTLLHNPSLRKEANETRVSTHVSDVQFSPGLLPTAIATVKDFSGKDLKARILLDECSKGDIITLRQAQKMQLDIYGANISLKGIGCASPKLYKGICSFNMIVDGEVLTLYAIVLEKITDYQPSEEIKGYEKWDHIKNLKLADPEFYKPRPIDILLGAPTVAKLRKNDIVRGSSDLPVAQDTALGYVLYGSLPTKSYAFDVNHVDVDLHQSIQRFWELEDISHKNLLSAEERECETHYKAHTKREHGGRYTVKLPIKKDFELGESRNIAVKRFLSLEKKFKLQPDFKNAYVEAMKDYLQRGHIEPAPEHEGGKHVYLPHHAVVRSDHVTTKLRVVFDASAKTTNGRSLNEVLMNGPRVQGNLFNILLRFRLHQVALMADIEKMFRQINLDPEDRNYQRIVWRENPNEPLRDYRITTVSFGTKPAPYLATRTLQQLADDEMHCYPRAAEIVKRDFYIDDLMTGCETETEAIPLREQLSKLLESGGFDLRKWTSNSENVLKTIPEEKRASIFQIDFDESTKALGIKWQPSTDEFFFQVKLQIRAANTKRTITSDVHKLYDPLGWLTPATITGKIMMQKLWKADVDWDEELDTILNNEWKSYISSLSELEKIKIPRLLAPAKGADKMLCGFSDASELAYAAVVYLRSKLPDGQIQTRLIAAKSKVAPVKPMTIPRLELSAALLLTRLLTVVSKEYEIDNIHAWIDSTVALAWIKGEPSRWKSFVAHRVAEIQEAIPTAHWHHVETAKNPADCASRGIHPSQLKDFHLWWDGPDLLQNDETTFSAKPIPLAPIKEVTQEAKGVAHSLHIEIKKKAMPAFQICSSFRRLTRITAYVYRFLHNAKQHGENREKRQTGPLTVMEIEHATRYWLKINQNTEFTDEIAQIKKKRELDHNSKILGLSPFLDEHGILRVGGRLRNADIDEFKKHPILISANHWTTRLILEEIHKDNYHAGSQLMLATLQNRYWLANARKLIRRLIHRCKRCARMKATLAQQSMGDLPASRVTPCRPFKKCGVDYAGPFTLKSMTPRSTKTTKAWVSLFVCFATRAIHLELVSGLSTEAFLAALRRFIARRGLSSDIYSDCGSNFVGASNELKKLFKEHLEENHNELIANELAKRNIQWHFNPPGAPHMGGLWEAGVKSFKHHFYRLIGNVKLNFEEMTTVITEIEAILNSRPLTPLSTDPDDLQPLTPGHFLTGDALNALPAPDLTSTQMNRLSRWQLTQQITQNFWKRWSNEYLTRLQQRPKWAKSSEDIKVGDLVLIKDPDLPPLHWKLGRIKEVHPGSDNKVRVVTIKTQTGTLKRPIHKICKLPMDDDSN